MKKATDTSALPTHGGLYEADPDTNILRAVEGGPPEDRPEDQPKDAPEDQREPAQTPDATTGEQT